MNNNKLDEAALLAGGKGVFAKSSYITIGSKDKPEDYIKKGGVRSTFGGKQFGVAPPKDGMAGSATNDVFFEKKHNWISDGDKYVDKLRYKDVQTEKKKGFLTSDFSKRDEFSNVIRTEQYREQLTQEDKFSKRALKALPGSMGLEEASARTPRDEPESLLYDLVFEKDDPKFSGCSKTHRDTKNPTSLSHDRTMGAQMTSTLLSFQPPTEFGKPEHAHRPVVKSTFYRKTNILFPAGCTADPE